MTLTAWSVSLPVILLQNLKPPCRNTSANSEPASLHRYVRSSWTISGRGADSKCSSWTAACISPSWTRRSYDPCSRYQWSGDDVVEPLPYNGPTC